jgi:hypothetical protein
VLSAVAVAVLAGCGSSRLSSSAFRSKANAICAGYHAKVAKLPLPRSVSAYETYARRTLPLYRSALASLGALKPPKRDEQLVARWLATDRRIELDVVRIARVAHTRQIPELTAAVARARLDDAASSRLARRLGLDVCARA